MVSSVIGNEGLLLVRNEGATRVLTLNRPEARNAFNEALLRALEAAVKEANADESLRALVITGTGEKAFCAGADIRQMQNMQEDQGREWALLGHDVFYTLSEAPLPVIAAINGAAVGGGCELALASDFRFADEKALLGQPEIKLGMIPGWGGTQRLTRLVGPAVAKDLVFSGRLIDAQEALRIGLVDAVAPAGTVLQQALDYAARFAGSPRLAVGAAKRAIDQGIDLPLREATLLEVEWFARSFRTDDRREGLAAFLEKRPAQFKGR
jgi:enoyl-CoA hydratase